MEGPLYIHRHTTFVHIFSIRELSLSDVHLMFQDYCWEEQGYSLANRLYPDIGNFLDDKFSTTYNLTYNT